MNMNENNNNGGGNSARRAFRFHKEREGELFQALSRGTAKAGAYSEFLFHNGMKFEAQRELRRKYVAGVNGCLFVNSKLGRSVNW